MGCGNANVQVIATRKLWRCKECKKQFSVRVGTIFEDSPIPFTKWLPAFWLLANTKNGTSSCELARALGVTQKTAWFMLHRIRETIATRTLASKFTGAVEVDENVRRRPREEQARQRRQPRRRRRGTVGRSEGQDGRLRHRAARSAGHTRVRAQVVPDTKTNTLFPALFRNVDPRATIYTDGALGYKPLADWGRRHFVIDHAVKYVEGHVTTNRIGNFWSCLKLTLGGTYICARPFHLDAYVHEQVWRFNEHEDNDGAGSRRR